MRSAGLARFEICGRDFVYVPAHASIDGDTVTVWSEEIEAPHAVRYGWANYSNGNLINSLGLPAEPFRTQGRGLTAASCENTLKKGGSIAEFH